MAKFVRVKEAPKELDKDCCVIEAPNFYAEILECDKKKPKSSLMTPHYLREILGTIGLKYADINFNALTDFNVSQFKGIPFNSIDGVHDIVMRAINNQNPNLINLYVDYYLKKRPFGTKLIYFLGDHLQTGSFTSNGIDEIKEKEVDVYLGKKSKKIIGKPIGKKKETTTSNANV